jgi:hypothetical protein
VALFDQLGDLNPIKLMRVDSHTYPAGRSKKSGYEEAVARSHEVLDDRL